MPVLSRIRRLAHFMPWQGLWLGVFLAFGTVTVSVGAEGGSALEYLIDGWETGDGLPNNSINSVLLGPDDYLWVASGGGLARFDGVHFETFRAGDTGLPDSRGLVLFIDSQQRLWAGFIGGCARFESGRWHAIRLVEDGVPADVRTIAESPDGTFWFGSNVGLHRWRNSEVRYFKPKETGPEAIRSILVQENGALMVLTWQNGYEFSSEKFHPLADLGQITKGRELWAAGRDKSGAIWVCGNNVLLRNTGGGWNEIGADEPSLAGHHVAFLASRNGDIWIATRNQGVHRWRNGRWLQISTKDGLAHDDVRTLCEDNQGNIWVASNGGGLNRLKPRIVEVLAREYGLGRHITSGLTQDTDGSIWIGTDGGGVWRYRDGSVSPFVSETGFRPDAFVWSLYAGRDRRLWMGSFNKGLFVHSPAGTKQYQDTLGLDSAWLTALLEDQEGNLWVGSHPGGVYCFREGEFNKVRDVGNVRHAAISAITQTRDGNIWVGTLGEGLMRWSKGKLAMFHAQDGLPNDTIVSLHEDGAGILWIGTVGAGLGWFENGKFGRIARKDGLPDDSIVQIQSDAVGNLWAGATLGLMQINREALDDFRAGRNRRITVVLYDKSDGLLTTQFVSEHSPLSLRAIDGSLWFSSASGVVRVDPTRVASQTNVPCMVIEQVLAGYQPLLDAPVRSDIAVTNSHPRLIAKAGQNSLKFCYTALDLADPKKVRFKYKLAGLDDDWQDAGAQRVADYRHVPPGEYQFHLLAQSGEGVWAGKSVGVALKVLPYFWQTIWFRIVGLVVFVALVVVMVRRISLRRIELRLARAEQERRVHQERARIAQDLHDDLGSSLTEINFLGSPPRKEALTGEELRERLSAIVQRSSRLAKALDGIVWAVNPSNDTLSATVNYLCSRGQESLRAAAVRFRMDVESELPEITLSSEIRHNLLLAVNEAINNAMKHSGASDLFLRIRHKSGRIEIVVEDNGCGFEAGGQRPEGNGMNNMRRRIQELQGDFTVESLPGKGTSVHFSVPLLSI